MELPSGKRGVQMEECHLNRSYGKSVLECSGKSKEASVAGAEFTENGWR